MELRDYQRRSLDMLYDWVSKNEGNPCLVLPTAAGKSFINAFICKEAVEEYSKTRILMLTHVRELIEQNYSKLKSIWPSAPCGIYSASVGQKRIDQITFAGIQSIAKKSYKIGHVDIIIVDECHLINHKTEGQYRKLIKDLSIINPSLRVVGLTATPWRLGHGLITEGEAIFDGLIEPVSVTELIENGYLSILRSKVTSTRIDTSSVKKRGGEYVEKSLQEAVDIDKHNLRIAREIIERAEGRRKWLLFCTGVEHAKHMRDALRLHGITAEYISGKTSKSERERILNDHYDGRITALANANILTTGYDSPNIDLIAMIRPTLSPVLHVQTAGRGMRLKDHTDHCLFLDFAGNTERHGPITNIIPPKKGGNGDGEAPVKLCPTCSEILHLSVKKCPACGYDFPQLNKLEKLRLRSDDIMGIELGEMKIGGWIWSKHTSKAGNNMIKCIYISSPPGDSITEYFAVNNQGQAGNIAIATVKIIAKKSQADINSAKDLKELCDIMNRSLRPVSVGYRKDGKYRKIVERIWNNPPF